jgi:hypothetical protein
MIEVAQNAISNINWQNSQGILNSGVENGTFDKRFVKED